MTGQYPHGTITLYNSQGVRLTWHRYTNPTQRSRILERWKQDYGERFQSFYYHIAPDYREGVVKTMTHERLHPLCPKLKIPA